MTAGIEAVPADIQGRGSCFDEFCISKVVGLLTSFLTVLQFPTGFVSGIGTRERQVAKLPGVKNALSRGALRLKFLSLGMFVFVHKEQNRIE